jgi:hypothetical protein
LHRIAADPDDFTLRAPLRKNTVGRSRWTLPGAAHYANLSVDNRARTRLIWNNPFVMAGWRRRAGISVRVDDFLANTRRNYPAELQDGSSQT